ncbi:MAG: hypothetical protein KBA46_02650 [Candidatus Omnitrophica bacterium]|nr:hypothetical protein [Candidatus Omnitrophota bacterium]
MRSGFLFGDYLAQFFPWLKLYSASVKQGTFPFWVGNMHSGFPLMAEGQVAGLYPLNLILFFLLPFEIAYNYSFVVHFFAGGIFIYLLTRKLGADQWGGYIAALIFCFGSAYAGCLYNIVTLRTLIWFPLVLFFIECYFSSPRLWYLLFAGVFFGLQFLAGSTQVALYSGLLYGIYIIYKARLGNVAFVHLLLGSICLFVVALIFWLPQLALTMPLAAYSNRSSATLAFALWGSFSPLGFLGLFFPFSVLFLRNSFYIGVFGLFFALAGILHAKLDSRLRPLLVVLLISIFLALGAYNPFYVVLIQSFKFYAFRVPARFLLFANIALSALAGCGFTASFELFSLGLTQGTTRLYRKIIYIAASLFIIVEVVLMFFQKQLIAMGEWLVSKFIYNSWHHRHNLDYYVQKVRSLLETIDAGFSFQQVFVLFAWLLCVSAIIVLPFLLQKRKKLIIVIIMAADLFVFGFFSIGFYKEIKPFTFNNEIKAKNILYTIKSDKDIFRILPFGVGSEKLPDWIMPNVNLLHGLASVGAYTPLAGQAYRDALNGLEAVDDSLGVKIPDDQSLERNLFTLQLLNVKYVVSYKELNVGFLSLVAQDDSVYLYTLKNFFPRAFFTQQIGKDCAIDVSAKVNILSIKDGFLEAEIQAGRAGFVVFSENYFPGWNVYVDGSAQKIMLVHNLIQAVQVPAGSHKVVFEYKPEFFGR